MIALKIQSTNKALHLQDNFKLNIKRKSPLYFGGDLSLLNTSISLPTTLPNTTHNRRALGYPENISSSFDFEPVLVDLYLHDNYYDTGKLYVNDADPMSLRIQIVFDLGLMNQFSDKYLDDYEYFGTFNLGTFLQPTTINDIKANPENYDFFLPNLLPYGYLGAYPPIYNLTGFSMPIYQTPSLYVHYILDQIFAAEGYTITYNHFKEDIELSTLMLSALVYHRSHWGETAYPNITASDYVPHLKVSDFLKEIYKLFMIAPIINATTNEVQLIAHNSNLTNATPQAFQGKFLSPFTVSKATEQTSLNLKYNYTEEVTKELQQLIAADAIAFNVTNVSDLDNYEADDELWAYVSSKDIYIPWGDVETTNADDETITIKGWQLESAVKMYKEDTATTNMTINLHPLHQLQQDGMLIAVLGTTVNVYLPAIDGMNMRFNDGEKPTTGHLLFRRTPVDQTNATTTHEHIDGTVLGNYSLELTGEHGIQNTWHQHWNNYLENAKTVKAIYLPTLREMLALDLTRPYYVSDQHSSSTQIIYIKEASIILSKHGIQADTWTFAKV